MSKSTVVSLTPRVQLSIGGDGCTVSTSTGYLSHVFPLEALNHLRTIVTPGKMGGGGDKICENMVFDSLVLRLIYLPCK